jgi:hypothetical protein
MNASPAHRSNLRARGKHSAGSPAEVGRPLGRAASLGVIAVAILMVPLLIRSGLGLLVVPPYALVGIVLAIRRPRNPIGWLLVAIGYGFAVLLTPSIHATAAQFAAGTVPPIEAALAIGAGGGVGVAVFTALFVTTMVFPSGRYPGGRAGLVARWASAIASVLAVLAAFNPTIMVPLDGLSDTVAVRNPVGVAPGAALWQVLDPSTSTLPVVILLVIGTVSLMIRFRRARGIERQQLQWVGASIAFMVVAILSGFVLGAIVPSTSTSGVAWIPALVAYPTIPISVGIAVLRYRLFEIDRIVSRTIGWTLTTGTIVATFAGLVVGLQALIAPITGASTVAVAASTLVAFALFQPVRRRVQSAVDHRFNRSRYDAERIIGAFGSHLRDETDLARLGGTVVSTAAAAVHPASTTLWLRGPAR